jgi:membrane-associated phospholipid phosphatase
MDTSTSIWLNQLAQHEGIRQLAVAGAKFVVAVPALIVAYLFIRSALRRDAAALSSLAVAGAGTTIALAANIAATTLWFRARPYTALTQVHALVAPTTESSFFSDHTIAVTGLAFAALLVSRRWGVAALSAAIFVGVARVAVGAHYPTDVLTAAVVTSLAITVLLPARRPIARLLGGDLEHLPGAAVPRT